MDSDAPASKEIMSPQSGPDASATRSPPTIPDHELLRRIGRGSYGDVWLARNVMGLYRAVKVVHRRSFERDRPFEREFEGMRRFEPISRSHESQLDVLHVGRNSQAGCFYYVMELADDANAASPNLSRPSDTLSNPKPEEGSAHCAVEQSYFTSPATYEPRTLKHELQKRGRLPLEQCLRIGLSLLTALDHLHKHGLVHRDIKPSNIVFVHSIPKLADIGLIASMEEDMSCVGSPGYIPPEGCGTAQGDIYSLGKVIYEMSSGRDRQDFPQLPDDWNEFINQTGLLELNAIILKACESDPGKRYGSALEMHAEMALLQSGKSVRRLRTVERQLARLTKLSVAAGVVMMVAVAAHVGSLKQAHRADRIAKEETHQHQRADQNAKDEAQQRKLAEEASIRLEMQRAEDLFAADKAASGLASLAHVLRQNPTDRVASTRIVAVLTQSRFALTVVEMLTHHGGIRWAAFNPDGQRIVTASRDKTALIWDATTGRVLTPPLAHEAAVVWAEFSPDGTLVATASDDKTARIWDARTGEPLTAPLRHEGYFEGAQFSKDGQRLLTFAWDNSARLWDTHTGKLVTAPLRHKGAVYAATFSPDGGRVATASTDGTASIWDARSGQRLLGPLLHNGEVRCVRFSGDGSRIVTCAEDGAIRTWDTTMGKVLEMTSVPEPRTDFLALQFSPDGQRVLTGSLFSSRVWDAQTLQLLTPKPFLHRDVVRWAEFSPDGERVATASDDGTARVWDARTGQPLTEPLCHAKPVFVARFSPDGQRVVTVSDDKMARVWDIQPGQALSIPLRHQGRVWRAHFSPNGNRVVTVAWDRTVQIWDARTGLATGAPLRVGDEPRGVEYSADERYLVAAGGWDKTASVWNAVTRQPITTRLLHDAEVRAAHLSPNARLVVTASRDKTARVWNARTGEPLVSLPHEEPVIDARFHPDSQRLITVAGNVVCIWDARTGQRLIGPLVLDGYIQVAQFSHDGGRFLTATEGGTAQVWSTATGQPAGPSLRHGAKICCGRFSPDDRLVATASWDNTARIWDTANGKPVSPPLPHGSRVNWVDFSPDGQRLLTASFDKTARVWEVRTGHPLTESFQEEAEVAAAEFSPDGESFVTSSGGSSARIWEVPVAPLPAPAWLADLAEAVAEQRFNSEGITEPVPASELPKLKQTLIGRSGADFYGRWVKWFFADRNTRSISPNASITMPEYVRRLVEQNTFESLLEAVRLAPTNGLALARLAQEVLKQDPIKNPRRTGEAEWQSRRAMELSPDDREVARIRAKVLECSAILAK